MSELCKFCNEDSANHCPDCSCCEYREFDIAPDAPKEDGDCKNIYCEADLIDRGE